MLTYKILLVDDEPNVLVGYQRILEPYFEVFTANSGSEGLSMLETHGPFALIVADYHMPKMHGIKFLLQAKHSKPSTIRIMLTGKADLNVAMEAVNQGSIYKFLTKPCRADYLLESVIIGVEKYRVDQEEKLVLSLINQNKVDAPLEINNQEMVKSNQFISLPDGGTKSYEGQKNLYFGLTCWKKNNFSQARKSLLQAKEIFWENRAFSEVARACFYLAGLELHFSGDKEVKEADIVANIMEGLSLVKEHHLTSLFHAEKKYVLPVLRWGFKKGLEADYLLEVLTNLGEVRKEQQVEVYVLGSLKILRGNEEISEKQWRNPKVKQLFFYLLTFRHKKIDRDVLLEAFWPEKYPSIAANNFWLFAI